MANNDIEVEIKIALSQDYFLEIKEKIKERTKFVKTIKQIDEYYSPAHRNFVEQKFPFEWLRIGKRGGKTILNYKHFYPENVKVFSHCDELETEIKNPDQLKNIFIALNLKKLVTVDKVREVYLYNNEFEIVWTQ